MSFFSSSAYRELRKFFNNNLPTIRTIQRWFISVDAAPGITQDALNAISEKAALHKAKSEQLYVCLISDDMSIRQQVLFNEKNKSFEGFSENSGSSRNRRRHNEQNDKVPMLKEASVFMAVGPDFRITVAYQLLNGQDAIDRAAFTREIIRRIDLVGAKVITLTGDGLYLNMAVARLLGADFQNGKPYFERPDDPNEKIYIIFDPPHMFKLLRKYLSLQKLQHGEDKLQWELLEKLAAKQDSENFSLTKKLSQNHILWMDHKMNVKKAVQIFSNENADALEQLCEDFYESFIGCEKFVKFLRLSNNIFDIMNFGEGKKSDNHFKQPLSSSTIEEFRQLFDSFKSFLHGMTIELKHKKTNKRVPAITQMGFTGLLINIQSTIGIYEDYVKHSRSGVFYTFQYGQDHLETYFSLVRGSLGANNNPNAQQFTSAYRKLLFSAPHISGEVKTNCNVDFPNHLLNVSSRSVSNETQSSKDIRKILRVKALEIEIDCYSLLNDIQLEPYEQHVYALVASAVENKIINLFQKQTASACKDCLKVFAENVKIFDTLISKKANRGEKIGQPCSSTLQVIWASEKINESLQTTENVHFSSLAKTILININLIDSLYESTQFELHEPNKTIENSEITHKEKFLLEVVSTFLTMKSKQICPRISMEEDAENRKKRLDRRKKILAGK